MIEYKQAKKRSVKSLGFVCQYGSKIGLGYFSEEAMAS